MQEQLTMIPSPDLAARSLTPTAPTPVLRGAELLSALLSGTNLAVGVPTALVLVEQDPLASCGRFRGDTMRALMEVPGGYWARHPRMYARYVKALRSAAGARRRLPDHERMEFWNVLE